MLDLLLFTGEDDIVKIESKNKEEIKNIVVGEVSKRSKTHDKTVVFPTPRDHYEFFKNIEGAENIFSSWTDVLSCMRLSQNQNDFKHFPDSLPWFNQEMKDVRRLFEDCHVKKIRQLAACSCIHYFIVYFGQRLGLNQVKTLFSKSNYS